MHLPYMLQVYDLVANCQEVNKMYMVRSFSCLPSSVYAFCQQTAIAFVPWHSYISYKFPCCLLLLPIIYSKHLSTTFKDKQKPSSVLPSTLGFFSSHVGKNCMHSFMVFHYTYTPLVLPVRWPQSADLSQRFAKNGNTRQNAGEILEPQLAMQ